MSFLRVKKRVKFNVELVVMSLADVPLLNAVIFAKVRLMECGSFEGFTWHRPVFSYKVDFMEKSASASNANSADELMEAAAAELRRAEFAAGGGDSADAGGGVDGASQNGAVGGGEENPQPFHFQCRIPFDERTGELEQCRCKVSLRKEDRGGRAPQKLGFVVLNLSEFAASGSTGIQQSFLLDGYTGQRQDNSRVNVRVKMVHQAQDPLFKVPKTTMNATEEAQLNPADRKAPSADFSSDMVAAAGISLDEQNSSGRVTARSGGTQRLDLHQHFLSYQPNHHHYHHYEELPTSCTNFASTSTSLTTPTMAEGGGALDQRASWHGGGGGANHNYGNSGELAGGVGGQESALMSKLATEMADGSVEAAINGTTKFGRRESEENHLADLSSPYVPPPSSMAFSTTSSMGGGSLANRIQKTRRDASGVIEEVLAETSALLAVEPQVAASRLSWEGIGGGDGSYSENGLSEDYIDDNEDKNGEIRPHHPHYHHPHHFAPPRHSYRLGAAGAGAGENSSAGGDYFGGFEAASIIDSAVVGGQQNAAKTLNSRLVANNGGGALMPFVSRNNDKNVMCNNNNNENGDDMVGGGGVSDAFCGSAAKSPAAAANRAGIVAPQDKSRAIAGAKS